MTTQYRVIVFGSTGAVGAEVVRQALVDRRIAEVAAVTRRPLALQHERLREVHCSNFLDLEVIKDDLRNQDVCFYCLGRSQLQVKDPDKYREITLDFTLEAARKLLEYSPSHSFHFLSGQGADPSGKSKIFFARVKGETEVRLKEMPLENLMIWRPGYINPVVPRKDKVPLFERIARPLYPVLRRVFPGMATDTVEVAQAMLQSVFEGLREETVENRMLQSIASRYVREEETLS